MASVATQSVAGVLCQPAGTASTAPVLTATLSGGLSEVVVR